MSDVRRFAFTSRWSALVILTVIAAIAVPASLAAQQVEVTYWGHASHAKAVSGVIAGFEKANPNIKINLVPTAETEKKLLAAIMAGRGAPDLAFINASLLGAFLRKDGAGLVNLAQPPYNGMTLAKDFVPYIFSALITPSKKLLGLPADVGTLSFFYRRDAFAKVGVDPAKIKSWDEFIATAKKLRANGQYVVDDALDLFQTIIGSDNANYFDEQGRLNTASPSFVKALKIALAVRAADLDAQIAPWSAEQQVAMKEGKVVGYVQASWYGLMMGIYAPELKGQWAVAPLPGGDAIAQNGMGVETIPEQSKHKVEAWKFMQAVTASTSGVVAGMKAAGFFWVPSYMPAWTEVAKVTDPMFAGQATMAPIIATTKRLPTKPFVITDKDELAQNLLLEKVRGALKTPDSIDPQDFLNKATEEIISSL